MLIQRLLVLYVFLALMVSSCNKDVSSVNHPAEFDFLANTYYGREESPVGTVHALLRGTDEDNDPFFFYMSENPEFIIDSVTGDITNTVVFDVDNEPNKSIDFNIEVAIRDIHGEGESGIARIRIGDSTSDNPAAQIEGPTSFSIQENVHDMVAQFTNTHVGSWQLQDTTFGIFYLYPAYPQSLNSSDRVTLHATYQDYETLPNTFTGTLVYTYPASGLQSSLGFTLEITNELDPF